MGRIYDHENGYMIYESDNGVRYELLEGQTMGGRQAYTSDKVFVSLDYYESVSVADEFVGWFYGATDLEHKVKYTLDYLETIVNRWESEHKDLIDQIKKGE